MKWRSVEPSIKGGTGIIRGAGLTHSMKRNYRVNNLQGGGGKRGGSLFFTRSLSLTFPSFPLFFLPLFHLASIDGEGVVGVDERRLPPCAHPEATPRAKCVVGHHHLSKSRATALWISHDLKTVPVLHFHTKENYPFSKGDGYTLPFLASHF